MKNVGLRVPKSPKMLIFGKNLPLRENPGVHKKTWYRCTTRNLPLRNGTITVLKITILHSVSVITNFVIQKRYKKKPKKNHTLSSTVGARPTIPTILCMVMEEVHTIIVPPNFIDPISSFATMGLLKICGKMPPPRTNAYNLVVCPPKATKQKTQKLPIDT